ncbi:sensor histidine kinase [Sulfitobacter mediterraneus]|uniref:ATP-binding protein n=1 Tax=Sulfitobacter mediterraneus TaxID=83219 RepID=UPI0019331613|nr:ATP-binding protein [Sulfitobacter mediterraneus]MBM1631836.1 sensor histidine kinase [Sulfitobacter mediterraneus]MBM1639651.1 sensor histidine kinase [Sulfitobacter mediterraneus]MBM1643700.1 sensor histidine kinase [Sulfitobacter mediterraneus]MBM1647746.1 sensor histidine kinase [Sulfitobacter mediterraneus]MBM1651791.1 sensor histidine kinase [Sulfitobacter mediterraneus]
MSGNLRQRAGYVLAFLLVVAALSGGVWRYAFVKGLDQLAARGQADLALAGDRLVGQLQRYRDLAVMLADHPTVAAELSGIGVTRSTDLLLEVADKSAALDVLIVDAQGRVAASAIGAEPADLAQQRYIKRALRGALGWGHGPGEPLTRRAFFHAAPVFDPSGRVQGAVVVMTDLNGIDYNWRGTNPPAFFTDAAGEVYISNRSEILFWQRPEDSPGLLPPQGDAPDFSARYIGGHEIWQLGWGPYLPQEGLHLTQALPVIGLTGEVLLDVAQTRQFALAQAAAVAALCLAFGSLLFLAAERRRALTQANVQLEARVAERTAALRDTNAQLRREAAEREEAQAALRRAQDDLVQAGKLSALGQMSAGISHELNQPLMAIRSFAENAVQFMDRGAPDRATENLTRISDMARRMGRIIQNLRAFARQENRPDERVELRAVLQSALDLTANHIADAGVELIYDPAGDGPLWVRGGEVRLGQVFVNLITNAVDAMSDSDLKVLRISVTDGDALTVNFRDTGPGIEMPDKVFDPFYTTKPAGDTGGMGLGLSISYGIVQSFGGQIKGSNCEGSGALFSVTLERAADQVKQAEVA